MNRTVYQLLKRSTKKSLNKGLLSRARLASE